MPDQEWQQSRQELLDALRGLIETPAGIALGLFIVLLFLGAIGLTVVLLVSLRRRSPRVSIPAGQWGAAEVCLAFGGWFVLQIMIVSAVKSLFPQLPATPFGEPFALIAGRLGLSSAITTAQITGGAIAGLIVVAGILQIPATYGQPLSSLGIGTGSMASGGKQGFLVWLCAIPGGFALLVGWLFTLMVVGIEPDTQGVVDLFQESLGRGDWGPAAVIMAFGVGVAPLVEELLFRAVIFRYLSARFGLIAGVVVSSVLFGLIHGSLFAFVPIAILGALLALVLHHTGSVWSCVGLHAVFNAGQFVLMFIVREVWQG